MHLDRRADWREVSVDALEGMLEVAIALVEEAPAGFGESAT